MPGRLGASVRGTLASATLGFSPVLFTCPYAKNDGCLTIAIIHAPRLRVARDSLANWKRGGDRERVLEAVARQHWLGILPLPVVAARREIRGSG
jgi:hypothetical protein